MELAGKRKGGGQMSDAAATGDGQRNGARGGGDGGGIDKKLGNIANIDNISSKQCMTIIIFCRGMPCSQSYVYLPASSNAIMWKHFSSPE